MKILVVCDYGINRSQTIASRLKFWGHDAIAAGVKTNAPDTLAMLGRWADRIITTDSQHMENLPADVRHKVQLWAIPDVYPGSFNKALLQAVRKHEQKHRAEYKT